MSMPEREERAPPPAERERRDARTVLAVAGPLLFMPPALTIADRDVTILGVPSLVVYVFAAWFLGIVLTLLVSRPRRGG